MLIHDSATAQQEKDPEAIFCINSLTQATHLPDNTIFSGVKKKCRCRGDTLVNLQKPLRKLSGAGLPFR